MNEELTLGQFIKSLRKKAGISSTLLASKLEKGNAYISQIENERIINPDYDTSRKMLEILNVDKDKINDVLASYNIFPTNKGNGNKRGVISVVLDELHQDLDNGTPLKNLNLKENDDELVKECVNKVDELRNILMYLIEENAEQCLPVIEEMKEMTNNLLKDITKQRFKALLSEKVVSKEFISALEELIIEAKSKEADEG